VRCSFAAHVAPLCPAPPPTAMCLHKEDAKTGRSVTANLRRFTAARTKLRGGGTAILHADAWIMPISKQLGQCHRGESERLQAFEDRRKRGCRLLALCGSIMHEHDRP